MEPLSKNHLWSPRLHWLVGWKLPHPRPQCRTTCLPCMDNQQSFVEGVHLGQHLWGGLQSSPWTSQLLCCIRWTSDMLLRSWALGPISSFIFPSFFLFSQLICTYRVTWPSLLARNLIVPLFWTPLLFSSLGRSVTPIVCDSIVLWPLLFVMPIVLLFCMLSQVAALMYISWTYFLELGLKPDIVCNSLLFWVLVAWPNISLFSFFEFVFKALKMLPIPLYLHPDISLSDPFAFITFQNTLSY